jgi:hypothetical protein
MEQKIEEARREFNAILEYVIDRAIGREIHEVERSIYRMLLGLGRILLELFILATGTGKNGETLAWEDGAMYRYMRDSPRKYLSIFGEITIFRAYYRCEGHEGLFPLDASLNLPERKYSYVLQDWIASKAVESSYERAAAWVNRQLYLELAHRPIQRVTRDCTEAVEEFMESLGPPPAETEGTILVHTVDCKGVRMRPEQRDSDQVKTDDKPGEKRMACVAQTYSIGPHYRPREAIVDSFFGEGGPKAENQKDPPRPEPLNRRTFVSLRDEKSEVFRRSQGSAKCRVHGATEEKLVLIDGERVLWKLSGRLFPDWTQAIDFTHVVGKLRIAGELHYGKGPDEEEYGRERALLLLEGSVRDVLEDLQTALEDGTLSDSESAELKSKVVGYFQNNRHRMAYDQYLARGLPIATGIIESACNSLIKIRMEGPGMFWSIDGAEAILKLRGVFLDGLWDEFWAFRTERERKRLYAQYDNIRELDPKDFQQRKAA